MGKCAKHTKHEGEGTASNTPTMGTEIYAVKTDTRERNRTIVYEDQISAAQQGRATRGIRTSFAGK